MRVEAARLGEGWVEAEVAESDEPGPSKLQAAGHDLQAAAGAGQAGKRGRRCGKLSGVAMRRRACKQSLPSLSALRQLAGGLLAVMAATAAHLDVALAQGVVDDILVLLHHHGAGGVDLKGAEG